MNPRFNHNNPPHHPWLVAAVANGDALEYGVINPNEAEVSTPRYATAAEAQDEAQRRYDDSPLAIAPWQVIEVPTAGEPLYGVLNPGSQVLNGMLFNTRGAARGEAIARRNLARSTAHTQEQLSMYAESRAEATNTTPAPAKIYS